MGLAYSDVALEESGSQMFSYTASRALGHSDDAGALPTASGRQCAQGRQTQSTRKRFLEPKEIPASFECNTANLNCFRP